MALIAQPTPKTTFETYQMRLEVGTPRIFVENDINSCTKSSIIRLLDIDTHLVKQHGTIEKQISWSNKDE